jgi:hypothetical protein
VPSLRFSGWRYMAARAARNSLSPPCIRRHHALLHDDRDFAPMLMWAPDAVLCNR